MSNFEDLVRYFAEVEPGQLDDLEVGIRRQAVQEGSGPEEFLSRLRRESRLRVIAEARENTR